MAKKLPEILLAFGELYDREVSPALVGLYEQALSDLNPEQIEAAALEATKTLKYFPKPAELRELALGNERDDALLAYAELQAQISSTGAYGRPVFDERMERTVRLLGGWQACCRPTEDEPFFRKRFIETYLAECHRETIRAIEAPKQRKELAE